MFFVFCFLFSSPLLQTELSLFSSVQHWTWDRGSERQVECHWYWSSGGPPQVSCIGQLFPNLFGLWQLQTKQCLFVTSHHTLSDTCYNQFKQIAFESFSLKQIFLTFYNNHVSNEMKWKNNVVIWIGGAHSDEYHHMNLWLHNRTLLYWVSLSGPHLVLFLFTALLILPKSVFSEKPQKTCCALPAKHHTADTARD